MKEKDGLSGVGELKAGRALDVQVAERVMGWTNVRRAGGMMRGDPAEYPNIAHEVPRYSTDIAAAWEVVERMLESGQVLGMHSQGALIDPETQHSATEAFHVRFGHAWDDIGAKTASLAICLAALKAVEHTPESPSVVPVESSSFGEPK